VSLGIANPLDGLTLQARSLRNSSGSDVSLGAREVRLVGMDSAAADPVAAGEGTLSIMADSIDLVGKDVKLDGENRPSQHLTIDGFARTSLSAGNNVQGIGDIRGVGDIRLRVGGDLDLSAARVTASSGGRTFIDAIRGTVRITGTGADVNTDSTGILGGSLAISASTIEHSGTVFLPSGLVSLQATSNLSLQSGSVIDVSGQLVRAADRIVGTSGGTVRLASGANPDDLNNHLTTAVDSLIDVRGAGGADGGRIIVHAQDAASLDGELRAGEGGAFDMYAGSLANTSDLIARLQTSGFTERQSLHLGTGDLTLDRDRTVTARTIEWTTDQGQIHIDGTMRAPSEARRSSISLYGADGVTLGSTAVLNADANTGVRFGGDIEIGATRGSLALNEGSVISARGDVLDGSLRLRAAATANDVSITSLASTIRDVDSVVIEAVRSYDVGGTVGLADFDNIRNDLAAYMAGAGVTIRNRLDSTSALGLRVQAGMELRHDGDLILDVPTDVNPFGLDLASWRFGGEPVAMTVRASGDITVNGIISDGFQQVIDPNSGVARTGLLDSDSATLRFAAGANLASANPNAVVRGADGSFILGQTLSGASSIVRTGTGDIRVSAAGDVLFNSAGAGIYTGGVNGAPMDTTGFTNDRSFSFADRGGNVSIVAGRDVKVAPGMEVQQSVSAWQRRQGTADGATPSFRTQWGTDLTYFGWNLATLGGGDLNITAGNDVTNIAATAADSAVELVNNQLTRFGGGSLSITAGNDINSSMLYVARSEGHIRADGGLGMTRISSSGSLGSLLMLGDAQVSVVARDDINVEKMFNPTALVQQTPLAVRHQSVFFTYGDHSAVDLRSHGGDVTMNAGAATRLAPYLGDPVVNANTDSLKILPSSLTMMSMTRDVNLLDGDISLFPSDTGQLDIFAARDFFANDGATINMSDLGAGEIATPLRPVRTATFGSYTLGIAGSARHINDHQAALITAGRDIVNQNIIVAKSTSMTAGRDIINTSLRAQNLRASDVTLVRAGRDLRYSPNLLTAQMSVGGPGRFDVITGRHLDLGFSAGLTTTGRLLNPAIQAEEGADLNVLVGMGRDMNINAFVDDVIGESSELREALLKFMIARTGDRNLAYDAAESGFKALDPSTQRSLVLDLFYGELVGAGRDANRIGDEGYLRGYRAIDALFPGSRPEEGETNPYHGDLTMAFSRIYTLSGGDVSIAVPGGLVNVGLANPPPTINTRDASQLGIVAQRAGSVRIFTNDDVLVNQSRVFTLLGGDIAIWSTFGDIDAGRGSKSSLSAPPPGVLVDANGQITLNFAGAVTGSGIRTIITDESVEPGDVDLIAPQGIVNAGEAGIGAAGNLNIAAKLVVGLDNIDVGGLSTGVPAETSGLGASLASVSAAASSSSSASASAAEDDDD
ncbi:MAG: filamentous hemagglutinin family protein, partial [Steroidobacter sp.]